MIHFRSLIIRVCFSQSPHYRSPSPRFLSWSVYKDREMLHFQSLPWHVSRESPIKKPPLQVPLTGPLGLQRGAPFPEPIFTYLSEYPVKKPSLQVPRRVPVDRDAQFPEPSFTYLSKSPEKEPPTPQVLPIEPPIVRAFFDVITTMWRFKSSLHY